MVTEGPTITALLQVTETTTDMHLVPTPIDASHLTTDPPRSS